MRPALAACLLAASSAAAEPTVSSRAHGFRVALLDALPSAPHATEEPGVCPLVIDPPVTLGGQVAKARGWQVTAELPFGPFTAVSFVGRVTPMLSATCELTMGNVGVFAGDRLVALVQGTLPDEPMIGRIRPFGPSGLRILSGDVLPVSMADISLDGDSLTVTEPAREEPICDARAIVPRVEGLPIDEARRNLQQAGWTPVPGSPTGWTLGWTQELAGMGLPEIQDCSGTGLGLCVFAYDHPAARLTVVTTGELGADGSLPAVVSYQPDCHAPPE